MEYIRHDSKARVLSKASHIGESSWASFMSDNLFRMDDRSIVSYEVSERLWLFLRLTRWLVQRIFKKVGTSKERRDLNKIWDKKTDVQNNKITFWGELDNEQ